MLGCNESRKANQNSVMDFYRCSFQGDSEDISGFLNKDSILKGEIGLQLFANHYLFFEGEDESLMMYVYRHEDSVFETFHSRDLSAQYDDYRKYRMYLTDSTSSGFEMIVESADDIFTQMNDKSIVIECVKKE